MELFRWGQTPWGEWVLTHISWTLFWAAFFAGLAFLVAHAAYRLFSRHEARPAGETDALEQAHPGLPARIRRHSVPARLFHWVMAAAMFVLLGTAFLPVVGVRFAWVTWHWTAGLVLTASIVFHVIHASVFLDFWSIWVSPRDLPEMRAELRRELGHHVEGPKPGKYPLGNRLYHLVIVLAGLGVVGTGLLMLVRVRTPFLERNPYLLGDGAWGLTYVLHGTAGVALVGLVIAHVYFALRPEKWWITGAMVRGSISRRQYLEHHDPKRWTVESR